MKKIKIVLLAFLAIWLLIFEVNTIQFFFYDLLTRFMVSKQVPKIHVNDVPDHAILLDTRSFEEYQISHLPQAQWVDSELKALDSINIENRPVVLYCSIGVRSGILGEQLMERGVSSVYNLDGGLFKWFNLGRPVVRDGKQTKDVHPFSNLWGIWLEGANKRFDLPNQHAKIRPVER